MAGQVRGIIVKRNKNKEPFQFSQGIWHQTKEDMVVPATATMETGAILEHQPGFHWRKMLIQMTASLPMVSILTPPVLPSPILFRERGDISPLGRGQAGPL